MQSASSERLMRDRECENKVKFAAEVFDLITQDPRVILSGMDAEAVNAFVFIRQWVKDEKSRDELIAYTKNRCSGVEV